MIITFCGHSKAFINFKKEKLINIFKKLSSNSPLEFLLGGYGEFDKFALSCAVEYKTIYSNSKLIFVTPYINQSYGKLQNAKYIYDEIIYPPLESVPKKFAIIERNKWMVEKSDFIISYISHDYGGAFNTYKHAKKLNKKIINLYDLKSL